MQMSHLSEEAARLRREAASHIHETLPGGLGRDTQVTLDGQTMGLDMLLQRLRKAEVSQQEAIEKLAAA